MDAAPGLPVPERRANRWRRAACWFACPTGGRSGPDRGVEVNIGEKKQSKFDADAMLDFQVQLVLGDQQLSQAEWRELMAAEDGLVLLRGQWVEVDRQKLREALDHWKKVEEQAEDGGISFIEGMRLLAGAPEDLADDGDADAERQWSFVHAGNWLGGVLADLRSPENLAHVQLGDAPAGNLAAIPGNRRRLVVALVEPGARGVPGRRHGTGQDDPGPGAAVGAEEARRARKPRCWSCRRRCWPTGRRRWPALRPRSGRAFVHPSETPKEELARIAAAPPRRSAAADLVVTTYGMLLRQPWLLDVRLAAGGARRGAGDQEPGRPADESRQAAEGRRADRA